MGVKHLIPVFSRTISGFFLPVADTLGNVGVEVVPPSVEKQKILTVAVPVYDTEKYIARCLDSLADPRLLKDLEVVVVNDGSTDQSAAIARKYQKRHPRTFRVVDQENGGHGAAINKGLALAKGKYFRVVDSDDWVDPDALAELIGHLKQQDADLVYTDYVQDNLAEGRQAPCRHEFMQPGRVYRFDEVKLSGEYPMLPAISYKTEVLRQAGLSLPEKTFYVDMEYLLKPIPWVNTLVFYPLVVYHYFIGRPDQSVDLNSFVQKYDHHDRVVKRLLAFLEGAKLTDAKRDYLDYAMVRTLWTHYMITSVYTHDLIDGLPRAAAFDAILRKQNPRLYRRLNRCSFILFLRLARFFGWITPLGKAVNGTLVKVRDRALNYCNRLDEALDRQL